MKVEKEPQFTPDQKEQIFQNLLVFESEFPEEYLKILKAMYQTGFEDLHLAFLDWKDERKEKAA